MSQVPQEIVTACCYWVLLKAERSLTTEEVAERARAMTEEEVREARALHAARVNADQS